MNNERAIFKTLNGTTYKQITDFIKQYGNEYREKNIINLFRHIFQLLEENNLCFSSGTFVFENDTNILFNLLTFNKLILPSNTYNCNAPKKSREISNLVDVFATDTHKKVYDKNVEKIITITPGPCIPEAVHAMDPGLNILRNTKMTKFEISFTEPIKNFCGICKQNNENDDISETKGSCLYYPFTVKSNLYPGKKTFEYISKLLFVKFEKIPTKASGHGTEFFKNLTGTKKEYRRYPPRREDDSVSKCNYTRQYYEQDVKFYKKYSPTSENDIQILNWYNRHIRTGCEFFVTNNLLISFITDFLLIPVDCVTPSIREITPDNISLEFGSISSNESALGKGKHKKRKSIKKKITKRHINKVKKTRNIERK